MNSNKHYITAFCIPCNIYSYSYTITVTFYQTCLNFLIKKTEITNNNLVLLKEIHRNFMQVIKFYSRDKIEEIPLILETYSLLPKMFVF